MEDARLGELARRLGATAAERLDVERAVRGVLERLQEPRETESRIGPVVIWWTRYEWLRVAAVLLVLAGAGVTAQRFFGPIGRPAPADVAALASDGLNELSADQLRQLLQEVDRPLETQRVVASQDASLEDLSVPELRRLLESLEG